MKVCEREYLSIGNGKRRLEGYEAIRIAVANASRWEGRNGPFKLSGRGHEPRVTLDRRLAAILRGQHIPRVFISGFGANYYYPLSVFRAAADLLKKRLGTSPIALYGSRAYLTEIPNSTATHKRHGRRGAGL